jgi:K+-sensing histidine kinase KdpD
MSGTGQLTDEELDLQAQALKVTAETVGTSSSLEELTRPFLELLQGLTGLESTYLTEIREEEGVQEILFARNSGALQVSESLLVPWEDTVCKRALESKTVATTNVDRDLPGSPINQSLGLVSYVSVPVTDQSENVIGTLCGASKDVVTVSTQTQDIMRMLARLIADQWRRDREYSKAQRRAEQAEERLRQRALFLAEAEHKLKTPLTIIRGWSDLLSDDWDDLPEPQRKKAISTIHDASLKAGAQVDQLLHEARSEVLSNQLSFERLDLGDLVARVGHELDGSSTDHDVITEFGSKNLVVKADSNALWQALWHLGENALKYSPSGTVVTLGLTSTDEAADISVSDQGPGVPLNIDLFAPFTRGDNTAGTPGTGLGLHIVRNLIEAMGGEIAVENATVGTGARFEVTLPLC